MTSKEPESVPFQIKRVKDISFFVNEHLYVPDPKKLIKIEMNHTFGTNNTLNLINFTLRLFLHYEDAPPENVLADIRVQNVFEVPKLKEFIHGDKSTFPFELLASIVGVSISHARALFTKNLSGTVFQEVMLPITNPIDVTNHFFPLPNNQLQTEILNK